MSLKVKSALKSSLIKLMNNFHESHEYKCIFGDSHTPVGSEKFFISYRRAPDIHKYIIYYSPTGAYIIFF